LIHDGEMALLRDPHDIPAWIAAVRRLLDDPAAADAMVRSAAHVTAPLAPARHAARVSAIYADLLRAGCAA
jgi:hypothetical protein